ncbi:LysR family transcriptional regulator, partial [Klebsiella quasipneumoniae subsp. similipneumoniae]|uniref:LysR family transcriptional regulator n=1 Tax=Klebsiella quasipneumoniae TaxID=1463165 RepID=UPI0038D2345C
MNLNLLPDLALFVQIVDQGSFSAVARQSGITPSAVSRSVSRLEREMGCKLLQRTTRKLRLNDAGETVYQHAQQMLEAARQAMDSAGSRQTVAQGKLTLSVPKAVGRFVIHPLMMAFFGTVAKLAMRQPFVLFKGLTFQKLCLPGAFRPGDHHNK